MKIILKFLVAPLLLLCILVSAQVKTNFNNQTPIDAKGKFIKPYKIKIDFEIASKNIVDLLQAEKKKNDKSNEVQLFKIAVPVSVDLDIAKLITWNYDENNAYGKFTIKLNDALSSSINFDKFYLPKGTEMYIYNQNGNMITGAITEKENNPNKIWGSWVYQGPWLTIEIKTPLPTFKQLLLHSNNIAYGYKNVYQVGGFGQSASCEINVVCPLGNGWQNERNSVALGISGDGTGTFTGSMIMNTCNTNRPFFLTANHNYEEATPERNVTGWRFTFQAWSSTCPHPGTNSDGVTYNGSALRSQWAGSDFCLVELNSIPPTNSGINYAGWTRNIAGKTQTTTIHHPKGDVMKITNDINPPTFSNFLGAQCWHLIVDNGTTEGGSSGAPYFDQNHRIIGQHYGIDDGNLSTCNQVSKYGGRFDVSWTGGGTNATRLSNWLDPTGTNAITTNTTSISNLSSIDPNAYQIVGPSQFCTSQTYSISGLLNGATVSWYITPEPYFSYSQSNNVLTVNRIADGDINITATVTLCGISFPQYLKSVRVGGAPITVAATQTACNETQLNVSGAATGATYNWSSANGTVLYNGTSTTATTSSTNISATTSGYDIAVVNTTNTCSQSVNASAALQYSYPRQIDGLYEVYSNGDQVVVSVNTTPFDTYYRWYINGVLDYEGAYAFTYSTAFGGAGRNIVCGDNTIRVEVIACDVTSSSDEQHFYKEGNCYYRSALNIELFPNPAKDNVTVRLKQVNDQKRTNQLQDIREVIIFDKFGAVKKIIKYPTNTKISTLNISDLNANIYYIEVSDGKNKARLPLSLQK